MITAGIDVLKGCEMAVVDILEAYLSDNMDDEVCIRFQSTLTEVMVAAEPLLYMPFVLYKVVKDTRYVQLQNPYTGSWRVQYFSTRIWLEI